MPKKLKWYDQKKEKEKRKEKLLPRKLNKSMWYTMVKANDFFIFMKNKTFDQFT